MAFTVKRLFYRGTGSTAGTAPRFTGNFNLATWTLDGDDYTYSVLASVHEKGVSPTVIVYLDNTVDFEQVDVATHIDASGNVTIYVSSNPDNRFIGKIIIV